MALQRLNFCKDGLCTISPRTHPNFLNDFTDSHWLKLTHKRTQGLKGRPQIKPKVRPSLIPIKRETIFFTRLPGCSLHYFGVDTVLAHYILRLCPLQRGIESKQSSWRASTLTDLPFQCQPFRRALCTVYILYILYCICKLSKCKIPSLHFKLIK